jgi:hypothetical protein
MGEEGINLAIEWVMEMGEIWLWELDNWDMKNPYKSRS